MVDWSGNGQFLFIVRFLVVILKRESHKRRDVNPELKERL